MNDAQKPRVLDVGQCDLDHGNITQMLAENFGAEVDRSHSTEDAMSRMRENRYDLVLINRLFDADGSEGSTLIRLAQADEQTRDTPVMLVSNFEEAQQSAVEIGAQRGFGKNNIDGSETVERLSHFLKR
ncbi:MAG: response regulator [Planctomycetota bacterium]|jgi:CheY-like chemotaxis protein